MRRISYFFLLSMLINITLSKRFRKTSNLGKINSKKNNTLHTILITTELNKEEIEKILNKNGTIVCNRTSVSEIIDDNDDFPDEIDIEIEDEIIDNGTTPHLTDYLEKESKTIKSQSFLEKKSDNYVKKEKFGKFLPLMSLIIFIFALIHFNTIKMNKKVVKTYKIYDFDFKEESLIIKND